MELFGSCSICSLSLVKRGSYVSAFAVQAALAFDVFIHAVILYTAGAWALTVHRLYNDSDIYKSIILLWCVGWLDIAMTISISMMNYTMYQSVS